MCKPPERKYVSIAMERLRVPNAFQTVFTKEKNCNVIQVFGCDGEGSQKERQQKRNTGSRLKHSRRFWFERDKELCEEKVGVFDNILLILRAMSQYFSLFFKKFCWPITVPNCIWTDKIYFLFYLQLLQNDLIILAIDLTSSILYCSIHSWIIL